MANADHWIVIIWNTIFKCSSVSYTVYPKKYAHGFCFAVLCCGYTLTHFPISIRLTSLALWQSDDCPSASKATLMNMDEYFMWIHYVRLHNHNKAKHNKTVCIFLGIYCISQHTPTPLCNKLCYVNNLRLCCSRTCSMVCSVVITAGGYCYKYTGNSTLWCWLETLHHSVIMHTC